MGITPQQFQQIQRRLSGLKRPEATPVFGESASSYKTKHGTVIGIDPSLRGTGYGIIQLGKPFPKALCMGAIKCPAGWEHSRCLLRIAEVLRAEIKKHKPSACVIEGLFFAQNLQTAIVMGEARGAGMLIAAEAGLEIFEIATRKVKQAIVGYGGAQKTAVARMVQRMLRLEELPGPDAADALALALAYAQETNRYSLAGPKRL